MLNRSRCIIALPQDKKKDKKEKKEVSTPWKGRCVGLSHGLRLFCYGTATWRWPVHRG